MIILTPSCLEYIEKYAEQKYPHNSIVTHLETKYHRVKFVSCAKEILTNEDIINHAGLHTHNDVIGRLFKTEEIVEDKYVEL